MKKILILFMGLFLTAQMALSQAPQSFNYQAAVRDNANSPIANQNVGIRVLILETSASGTVVYSETHSVITSTIGLVNLAIGTGTVVSGDFTTINWGGDSHYVRIELDETGGTAYQPMGTSQLLSVPYALYSESSGGGGTTYTAGSDISLAGNVITNTAPDQTVTLTGTGGTTITGTYPNFTVNSTDLVNDADFDPSNEFQTITQTGTSVTLSDGGGTFSVSDGDTTLWKENGPNIYRLNTKVGIGNNNPQYRIHVYDTLSPAYDYSSYYDLVGGSVAATNYRGVFVTIAGTDGDNRGMQAMSEGVSAGNNTGMIGFADNGLDNYGLNGQGIGTTAGFNIGVNGYAANSTQFNRGMNASTTGSGLYNQGIFGRSDGPGDGSGAGSNTGVLGYATGNTDANYSIYGISDNLVATDFAGYFDGDVTITGDLNIVGNLSKGGGTFKIDHPLDPENKYLVHSFVESPEMMNVYSGNAITGADSKTIVEMPDYFEAANKDFRYQLTVIGSFAQAIVFEEISNNQFVIATDQPNVKVSWQITAVRADPYAEQYRIVPVVEKDDKGTYIHPEVYNASEDKSENYKHKMNKSFEGKPSPLWVPEQAKK